VTLPARNPNSALTTPTPDSPHALPPQRDYLDQYTVQAGDTLGTIASGYGISLEALMQANALDETSILYVGMVLISHP
jgi:LysM repeat protein